MIFLIDLDGTLCSKGHEGKYQLAKPNHNAIAKVNELHEAGNTVIIWTARATVCDNDNIEAFTIRQLADWGVQYDEIDFDKREFDFVVDDKAICSTDWSPS